MKGSQKMDEEAKILLYNQLLKFTDMADVKRKRLINMSFSLW